jgi:hypothetical protein
VNKLSLDAPTVSLSTSCNNVNVLTANNVTSSFSYEDADTILAIPPGSFNAPGASVSISLDCGQIQIGSLNQDLASITYVDIPIPRLALSEIDWAKSIDTGEVRTRYGSAAIVTFYLDVPFPKKRFSLGSSKLEERSKWVGGHMAVSGSTSGPQGSQ